MLYLFGPVVPVPADAMEEENERSGAGDREREPGGRADEDGFQRYSAFAPEIFTARARLSESVRIYEANSPGELPTGS